jgi:hypothetical protein
MRDFFSPDFTRNASESSLRDGGMFSLERRGPFRSFRVNTDEVAVVRNALLAYLERLIGKMHRTGCRHGGMQWDNILNLAENPIWLSSGGFRPSYLCGKLSPSGELGS